MDRGSATDKREEQGLLLFGEWKRGLLQDGA